MMVTISGVQFPVETNEEVEFLLDETQGKDVVEVMIVLGDWLRACTTPDPTDDLASVVEAENG